MKIFGAVLIVSGGFLIGRIKTAGLLLRLKVLCEISELFHSFDSELRTFRRSPSEFLKDGSPLAKQIFDHQPIKGLSREDNELLQGHLCQLQTGTYREAISANQVFLDHLDGTVKKLQQENASMGKALPLVTGTVGLFIAVMLL